MRKNVTFGELHIGELFIDEPIVGLEYLVKVSENEARACTDDAYVEYSSDEVVIAVHR